MTIKQATSITDFQLFLFTLIYNQNANELYEFDYIDFYPVIEYNEAECKESIETAFFCFDFRVNISYQLYDKNKEVVKKVSFSDCGSINSGYTEVFIYKVNQYINKKRKVESAIISIKQITKLLEKTTFLLQCFERD